MSQEQMITAIQLALYRVGDDLRARGDDNQRETGEALRRVADEFYKIVSGYAYQ